MASARAVSVFFSFSSSSKLACVCSLATDYYYYYYFSQLNFPIPFYFNPTARKTLCLASLPLNLDFQLIRFNRELVGILFKRLELAFPLFPPPPRGRLSVPVTSYELGKYTYMFAFLNKLQQSSVDLTHLDLEVISSLDIVHCTGTDN